MAVARPRSAAPADELQRPTPAFAPRIRVRLTDTPLQDSERGPGQGTLDQIRRDMDALASLEPGYVVLDTYSGNPDDLIGTERAENALDVLLERVFDVQRQALR